MLRFINCKLDFVLENSRRLLKNPKVSLSQQCQHHAYCFSRQDFSQPAIYKWDAAALMPNLTLREVEVPPCRVSNTECVLGSQHQIIHYKDLYECYLQRLRQLYEALNALSTAHRNCKILSPLEIRFYRDIDEIVENIDRNLEFMYPKLQILMQGDKPNITTLQLALKCHEDRNLPACIPSSIQTFKTSDDSFETFILKCSKSDEPKIPEGNKELSDNKGPSRDQLETMQEYLVENFPKLLTGKLNYSIYTKDIEFVMNWYPDKSYSTVGILNYGVEIARLRLFVHLRLAKVKMTMLRVTNHTEDGSIKVRWRIMGLPHSTFLWSYFSTRSKESDDREWLDGFSVFYLNSEGLIKKHCIDRIVPEGESVKEKPSMMEKLALKLRCPLPT